MVLDRNMRQTSRYKRTLGTMACPGDASQRMKSPGKLGWKVCHIKEVRLGGRGPIREREITLLQSHFVAFLAPSNMFLVPLELGGLGELPYFNSGM